MIPGESSANSYREWSFAVKKEADSNWDVTVQSEGPDREILENEIEEMENKLAIFKNAIFSDLVKSIDSLIDKNKRYVYNYKNSELLSKR